MLLRMKCSQPMVSCLSVAFFSISVKWIVLCVLLDGWVTSMEVGTWPSTDYGSVTTGRVLQIMFASAQFIVLSRFLILVHCHCPGNIDPLSPSPEKLLMMVIAGGEVVVMSRLSFSNLVVVLVSRCCWGFRFWRNGSISIRLEWNIESMLNVSKQTSSYSDDYTFFLWISRLRECNNWDSLECEEREDSSLIFVVLFWAIIRLWSRFVGAISAESLWES